MGVVLKFRGVSPLAGATGFYRPADAARYARLPRQRLDAWRREGIVRPTLEADYDEEGESAGYSFDALVYLRVVRMLRGR